MSADESDECSIEEQQQDYFLDRLPNERKGEYRCRTVLKAPPGTTVLFQYRGCIIAAAVLHSSRSLPRPDSFGYTAAMLFDTATIRVFAPVGPEVMKRIWPREFSGFSHVKQKLSQGALRNFFASVCPLSKGSPVGRSGLALSAGAQKRERKPSAPRIRKGGWITSTKPHLRQGSDPIEVTPEHATMHKQLEAILVRRYGKPNVTTEFEGIDVCVRTANEVILFEIKSDTSPRAVIRNALGQVLEYAFYRPRLWKGAQVRLVIVGRNSPGSAEQEYLNRLRKDFRLPVSYETVKI
jgi:hypothetical protein